MSDAPATVAPAENPFPGPQPYRAADRRRFFGRDALVKKLGSRVLASPCTTLFGPSGAGKSSLMQAGVIPRLEETHDVRAVRVDGWPPGEAPLSWLVRAILADLALDAPPDGTSAPDALDEAMALAERRSERPILIYLDQLEQVLLPGRDEAETEALLDGIERLSRMPIHGLQIVLSLREDYLGRLRDRARGRKGLLDQGFRVGPLAVAEIAQAVCQAAAAGEPPQRWSLDELQALMVQVRVPGQAARGEAEAQAAYAQIVCRALFQQRARGGEVTTEVEAEPILRAYLETTLEELGALREEAQRLLEDHLVTADGSRTLRTEKELLRLLPAGALSPILHALEGAAILHAEEHQGSRYFEIGHDWLARRVFEQRGQREREDEERRREAAQQAQLQREREAAGARLARERAKRRTLVIVAGVSIAVAVVTGALGAVAYRKQKDAERARREAQRQEAIARNEQIEARDARIVAGFLALTSQGEAAWALKLLAEVKRPAEQPGWVSYASDALSTNALRASLRGHRLPLRAAVFSPDGERVLTGSLDGTARVWRADGTGQPVVLAGHEGPVTSAAWSPDGTRALTTSEDGTARVWRADGAGEPVVLKASGAKLLLGAWSPDGKRVVLVSDDTLGRIYAADGTGDVVALRGHTGRLTYAMFLPDGARLVTTSEDGTARVWRADGKGRPVVLKGHEAAVLFVTASADGARLVTVSRDRTARVWRADGRGKPVVLEGHEGDVHHAAISPDGTRVATASGDRTARIWRMDGAGEPVVLTGHELAVTQVAFRPDGQFVVTASADATARVWPVDGVGAPLVLRGHGAPVRSVVWSPDGTRLLTAAGRSERSSDCTAKVWSAALLGMLPRGQRHAGFFHGASVSADGGRVAAAYDDGTAGLWSADGEGAPIPFKGHAGWVASAALSPSGDRVVTASFDGTARVWRADRKGEPVVLKEHEAEVRSAAFSADGTRVVTASDDRTARVFRADGSGAPAVLKGHEDWLTSAAFDRDGGRVVTASLDHTARVFRADGSGAPVVLSGHRGAVFSAAFDRGGMRVVTASEDGTARIWGADGAGEVVVLSGRGGAMVRAVFSEEGDRVAASSLDGLIYVWRADGKGPPITLQAGSPALALAFLDGDQKLLAVGADDSLHTWRIDVSTLRASLTTAHADCLPADVRAQFLGEVDAVAQHAFAVCQSRYGRMPAPAETPQGAGDEEIPPLPEEETAPADRSALSTAGARPREAGSAPALPSLSDLGPRGRRVRVIVLPGDAAVESAGSTIRRRDGVIELSGELGEVRRLRVTRGTRYIERDVTIQDWVASPPVLDLMAKPSGSGGPKGASAEGTDARDAHPFLTDKFD